jgi:hypothetical protein
MELQILVIATLDIMIMELGNVNLVIIVAKNVLLQVT